MKPVGLKSVLLFAFHQLLAPYLFVVATAFIVVDGSAALHPWFPSITIRRAHWLLTETPFFPVQILVGLANGFWMRRFSRLPFGEWIWILPSLLLIAGILFLPIPPGQNRLGHLFGWSGLPPNRTPDGHPQLYEIVLTMPFYLSVAYSSGQRLSRCVPASAANQNVSQSA